MAVATTVRWDDKIERLMRNVFETLSEKDQRRFAAIQARQVGDGLDRRSARLLDEDDQSGDRRTGSTSGRSGGGPHSSSGCGSKKK